jgi:hypothetical protein
MAANPNLKRPALSLVPVRPFNPIAPAIVWPPVEGDTEHCAACGRPLNSHDVLTRGGTRAHLLNQDKHGFRDNKRIVHYSPAQKAEAQRRANETQTPAKPLETAPTVRDGRCSVERWRKFEDEMYVEHPRAAWLVLCARLEASEGKHAQAAGSVRLFRHELYVEREHEKAQAEAYSDYRDAVSAQTMAGVM